ncbi:hypothetical protein CXG81DRAFT_27284, partial [Caulochytrium protostelioides]
APRAEPARTPPPAAADPTPLPSRPDPAAPADDLDPAVQLWGLSIPVFGELPELAASVGDDLTHASARYVAEDRTVLRHVTMAEAMALYDIFQFLVHFQDVLGMHPGLPPLVGELSTRPSAVDPDATPEDHFRSYALPRCFAELLAWFEQPRAHLDGLALIYRYMIAWMDDVPVADVGVCAVVPALQRILGHLSAYRLLERMELWEMGPRHHALAVKLLLDELTDTLEFSDMLLKYTEFVADNRNHARRARNVLRPVRAHAEFLLRNLDYLDIFIEAVEDATARHAVAPAPVLARLRLCLETLSGPGQPPPFTAEAMADFKGDKAAEAEGIIARFLENHAAAAAAAAATPSAEGGGTGDDGGGDGASKSTAPPLPMQGTIQTLARIRSYREASEARDALRQQRTLLAQIISKRNGLMQRVNEATARVAEMAADLHPDRRWVLLRERQTGQSRDFDLGYDRFGRQYFWIELHAMPSPWAIVLPEADSPPPSPPADKPDAVAADGVPATDIAAADAPASKAAADAVPMDAVTGIDWLGAPKPRPTPPLTPPFHEPCFGIIIQDASVEFSDLLDLDSQASDSDDEFEPDDDGDDEGRGNGRSGGGGGGNRDAYPAGSAAHGGARDGARGPASCTANADRGTLLQRDIWCSQEVKFEVIDDLEHLQKLLRALNPAGVREAQLLQRLLSRLHTMALIDEVPANPRMLPELAPAAQQRLARGFRGFAAWARRRGLRQTDAAAADAAVSPMSTVPPIKASPTLTPATVSGAAAAAVTPLPTPAAVATAPPAPLEVGSESEAPAALQLIDHVGAAVRRALAAFQTRERRWLGRRAPTRREAARLSLGPADVDALTPEQFGRVCRILGTKAVTWSQLVADLATLKPSEASSASSENSGESDDSEHGSDRGVAENRSGSDVDVVGIERADEADAGGDGDDDSERDELASSAAVSATATGTGDASVADVASAHDDGDHDDNDDNDGTEDEEEEEDEVDMLVDSADPSDAIDLDVEEIVDSGQWQGAPPHPIDTDADTDDDDDASSRGSDDEVALNDTEPPTAVKQERGPPAADRFAVSPAIRSRLAAIREKVLNARTKYDANAEPLSSHIVGGGRRLRGRADTTHYVESDDDDDDDSAKPSLSRRRRRSPSAAVTRSSSSRRRRSAASPRRSRRSQRRRRTDARGSDASSDAASLIDDTDAVSIASSDTYEEPVRGASPSPPRRSPHRGGDGSRPGMAPSRTTSPTPTPTPASTAMPRRGSRARGSGGGSGSEARRRRRASPPPSSSSMASGSSFMRQRGRTRSRVIRLDSDSSDALTH